MLDNLRLDLTNSTVVNNLSTSNTNADADSLTSLKSGNRANGDQYATAGLPLSNWTSGNSYSPQVNVSGSVTAGSNNNTWTGYYTKDTIAPVTYGLGSGKIGAYYNYCAASAGSYCYDSISTDPNSGYLRDISSDICPKNWKMPTCHCHLGWAVGKGGSLYPVRRFGTAYCHYQKDCQNPRYLSPSRV